MTARLVYLGLDACDAPTARRMMAAGRLPHLAALASAGRTAPTRAPYGTFVGSTWPTFATGRRPERHGHWCWIEVGHDLDDHHVSPRRRVGRAFWTALDDAGVSVGVADVPHSLAPAAFGGSFLSEWGAHDRLEGTQWSPPDLLERIGVGPHPVNSRPAPPDSQRFAPCDVSHRSGHLRDAGESRALVDDLLEGIAAKQRIVEHLVDEHEVVVAVFGESHCVGHQLWHLHDPGHEWHDPAVAAAADRPLERVYERLDHAVGAIVDRLGPDALVLVHLSHGMTSHHDGTHLLDPLLWRIERRVFQPDDPAHRPGRLSSVLAGRSQLVAGRWLPVARRWAQGKPVAAAPVGVAGRSGRRFFQAHNNTVVGGVRLNVVGREQHGLVEPDRVDELLDTLDTELRRPINLRTGRPAVRRTVRAGEVHEGDRADHLPDLYVEWDRSVQIEEVWSPDLGVVRVPYTHWRTGDHHDVGLLLARGPGVTAGRGGPIVDLADLGVTIASSVGVDLGDVDGRPIEWIEREAERV